MTLVVHAEHFLIQSADIEATKDWWVNVLGMHVGPSPDFKFPVYWLYIGDRDVPHLTQGGANVSANRMKYLGQQSQVTEGSGVVDHIGFRAHGLEHDRASDQARRKIHRTAGRRSGPLSIVSVRSERREGRTELFRVRSERAESRRHMASRTFRRAELSSVHATHCCRFDANLARSRLYPCCCYRPKARGSSMAIVGTEHWVTGKSAHDGSPLQLYLWEKRLIAIR